VGSGRYYRRKSEGKEVDGLIEAVILLIVVWVLMLVIAG
jgi:hypothetical protein